VWFECAKTKGAKIIFYVKSQTFREAELKGFTVVVNIQSLNVING